MINQQELINKIYHEFADRFYELSKYSLNEPITLHYSIGDIILCFKSYRDECYGEDYGAWDISHSIDDLDDTIG